MQQEAINRSRNGINVSFQQKSTALSLVITGSAAIYYFVNMWPMRPVALANDIIPAGYGSLVLGTVAVIIVAQIVLQSVLAIGAGSASPATDLEQRAALKATRNAYYVLVTGMMAAVGSVFLAELTSFCTANIAILAFALAEIVKGASQLFYARR